MDPIPFTNRSIQAATEVLDSLQQQAQSKALLEKLVGELIDPAHDEGQPPASTVQDVLQDAGKLQICANLLGLSIGDVTSALQFSLWVRRGIASDVVVADFIRQAEREE